MNTTIKAELIEHTFTLHQNLFYGRSFASQRTSVAFFLSVRHHRNERSFLFCFTYLPHHQFNTFPVQFCAERENGKVKPTKEYSK